MSVWFNPARELDALLRKVAPSVAGLDATFQPELRPSDPRHADFQCNGAIAAAEHVGVSPSVAAQALATFENVKRRMEVRGTVKGVTVYDDFAHHPTAIRTTVNGLRRQVGAARILASRRSFRQRRNM